MREVVKAARAILAASIILWAVEPSRSEVQDSGREMPARSTASIVDATNRMNTPEHVGEAVGKNQLLQPHPMMHAGVGVAPTLLRTSPA